MERWRDIPGYYEGIYQVSDHGRVRRIARGPATYPGRILKPSMRTGRLRVALTWNNRQRRFEVHRLVLQAFIGPPGPGQECNHKNGIPTDNRLENLEWCSHQENIDHAYQELGIAELTTHRGEDGGRSKLTEDQVNEIRRLWATGEYCEPDLAERFNVHWSTIHDIISRRTWTHLPEYPQPDSTPRRGERINTAKLTADQVKEIRRLYASFGYTQLDLSLRFGVSRSQIGHIIRRDYWKHVQD